MPRIRRCLPRQRLEVYKCDTFTCNCPLVYTGTDWGGGDIGDFTAGLGSASACCAHCNGRYGRSVVAYIYRTDFDRCYCKNHVNPPSNCPNCQGRNSFEQSVPGSCYPIYNSDVSGNDLPGMPIEGVSQPGDCCTRCRNYIGSPGCVAWLWRRDFNRCYLKFAAENPIYCPQCVRGTP
eukprot:g8022.t1